jgi:nucleoside-diphosphate-sugar epimerase
MRCSWPRSTRAAALTGGEDLLRFGGRPYRPGERFQWCAATEHAERTLGWRARTTLHEGLRLTVDAARSELATEQERAA